jgi:DNA-binding NtrC family response regulator
MNNLSIFIVDDDMFYSTLFKKKLKNLGYENVTVFNDGDSCLKNLGMKPDVILLDYNMDNLSGYEVLKKIKRYDPNMYVVMVSAQEAIKPAVDALKHGAFDYIQKGEKEQEKIADVLARIIQVQEMLERAKPTFLKKIFQFL